MSGTDASGAALHAPPQATLTAGGICHNIPVEGHSRAGAVLMRDGVPAVPVFLGTVAGRPVTLDVMSLSELDELEGTLLRARVLLVMWYQDHPEIVALGTVAA